MKIFRASVLVGLWCLPLMVAADEWSDYNQIRKATALFVVHAFSPNLIAPTDIYAAVSDEYQNAVNEFEKKKLEQKYESETKAYVAAIRKINKFYVSAPFGLKEYDFTKGGFSIPRPMYIKGRPSLKDDGTAFNYRAQKAGGVYVDVNNFKRDIFLLVPVESAEKLAPALSKSRAAELIVYGHVTRVEEKAGFLGGAVHIHMTAKAALVRLESGQEIGLHMF